MSRTKSITMSARQWIPCKLNILRQRQSANGRETIVRVLQDGTLTSLGPTNICSVVMGYMKPVVNSVFRRRKDTQMLLQNLTRARD